MADVKALVRPHVGTTVPLLHQAVVPHAVVVATLLAEVGARQDVRLHAVADARQVVQVHVGVDALQDVLLLVGVDARQVVLAHVGVDARRVVLVRAGGAVRQAVGQDVLGAVTAVAQQHVPKIVLLDVRGRAEPLVQIRLAQEIALEAAMVRVRMHVDMVVEEHAQQVVGLVTQHATADVPVDVIIFVLTSLFRKKRKDTTTN